METVMPDEGVTMPDTDEPQEVPPAEPANGDEEPETIPTPDRGDNEAPGPEQRQPIGAREGSPHPSSPAKPNMGRS